MVGSCSDRPRIRNDVSHVFCKFLSDVKWSFCVAGAVFDEVQVPLFVAGAVLGGAPTHALRGWLRETSEGNQGADLSPLREEVKMLPIRIINSGAAQALKHVTECGLGIPPWIEAFAYDLEAA